MEPWILLNACFNIILYNDYIIQKMFTRVTAQCIYIVQCFLCLVIKIVNLKAWIINCQKFCSINTSILSFLTSS